MGLKRVAAAVVVAVALVGGTAGPAQAWHYPKPKLAKKIWRAELRKGDTPNCPRRINPRKGIRISDYRARGFRWAVVNINRTRCANGLALYRSKVGSRKWRNSGYFGSDFGSPYSCSYSAPSLLPNRMLVELTGMTCKGGRRTPKKVRDDPWF